jgi:hypothetical protein
VHRHGTLIRPLFLSLGGVGIAIIAGCSSIPGGASVTSDDDTPIVANIVAPALIFTVSPSSETKAGVTATAVPENIKPVLYYRYNVDEKINGNYIAMPSPPKIFTITKAPYYQGEPDPLVVKVDLQNDSTDVVRTGQAVCAFDLNGQTIFTVPLQATDLLPGHSQSLAVSGPALDKFKANPMGTLTVWIYGLNGNDKTQVYRWDIPYRYTEQMRQMTVELVGHTKSEDEAKPYEGKVERASAGGGQPL